MLVEYLSNPGIYPAVPQVGEPTFTRKFTGADEIIDWGKTPIQIHNQIRALGCGRTTINGADVKILETKIESGELKIVRIQPAGKKPMDWKSFVNGLRGAEIKFGEYICLIMFQKKKFVKTVIVFWYLTKKACAITGSRRTFSFLAHARLARATLVKTG